MTDYQEHKTHDATESMWIVLKLIAVAVVVALLFGCSTLWHYVGPDLSKSSIGPIEVTPTQMAQVCRGDPIGCTVCYYQSTPQHCVVYVLEGMRSKNERECRLPGTEPRSVVEHERCHTAGWRH
jgi:hypothetical protein